MTPLRFLIEFGFIFAVGISLAAGLFQLFNYRTAVSRWAGLLLIGISINLTCYVLLFSNLIPGIGRFLVVLQVFGYLLLTFSFMVFVIYFTGHSKWIFNLSMIFLTIIPMIILVLMVCQWGSLPNSLSAKGNAFGVNTNILKIPIGVLEGLFPAYANLAGFFSIFLLTLTLFNTTTHYHKTILALIAGALIIMAAGISEMIGANPFAEISILQSAVAMNTIPIILIVFTWKSVNSIPISQQLFKDTMRDGYLILDSHDKVVDFNQASKILLGEAAKIEVDCDLNELLPTLYSSLVQFNAQETDHQDPILYQGEDLIYEVMIYPIGGEQKENIGRMVVFHNVTDRDQLEDTLRTKNIELSRSIAFISSLSRLTLDLQNDRDPAIVMEKIGSELTQLGLKCFIALYHQDSKELIVRYFSESIEVVRVVEKIFSKNITGYRLDRKNFSSLYQVLETRQIHFLADLEDGLAIFLGNFPGWVVDPLMKASPVGGNKASMIIPLIADEQVTGLMGVWGNNLQEADIAPFRVFGSQVGWAIEKAILHQVEHQHLDELSHSNSMITALSRISSQVESTLNNEMTFMSLGEELAQIDLSCAIVLLDPTKEVATIRYVSIQSEILKKVERLTGLRLAGYQIPRKFWPGEKSITEGIPVWYGNVEAVFSKLFPHIPGTVAKKTHQMLKGVQNGQICFLPLRIHGNVIGVMPIWGQNISPKDNPTLSIFGDQVAAILQRNNSYENEIRKSDELTRLNSMIMALSGVASQLDNTTDFNRVLGILGKELKKLNLSCMIGILDDAKQMMKIEYLSMGAEIKQIADKLNIPWPEDIRIPRHLWPTDKAVTERKPFWDPYPIEKAYRMFPFIPKELFNKTMKLGGLDLTEPVCYLPMLNEEDVIGIFAVWGKGLRGEDISALSIFANQVSTAIWNNWLYVKAQNEIAERSRVEAQIREALTEKEVLLKEVHHRVKNNLQVISSLLNLQAAEITDPNTLIALKESQNRVRSMALIHEKLYQSNDLAHIDFSTYLQSLVYSLAQSYRVQANKVEIQVQAEKIFLDLDTAIPCGLMVNELVSNSIKYAFPEDRSGNIIVSFKRTPDYRYSLAVCDDGIGLPPGFDYTNSSSLGLKLVNSLIRQIDAELSVDGAKGTRFDINFEIDQSLSIPPKA